MNLHKVLYLLIASALLQVGIAETADAQQIQVTLKNQAHKWISIVAPGPPRKVIAHMFPPHGTKTVSLQRGTKLNVWLDKKLHKVITVNNPGVQTITSSQPPPKKIPPGAFNVSGEWSRGDSPSFDPSLRNSVCTISMNSEGIILQELGGKQFWFKRSATNPNSYSLQSGGSTTGTKLVFNSAIAGYHTHNAKTRYFKRPLTTVPPSVIYVTTPIPNTSAPWPTGQPGVVQPVPTRPGTVTARPGNSNSGASRPAGSGQGSSQSGKSAKANNSILKSTGRYSAGVSKSINFKIPSGNRANVAFEATVYLEDDNRQRSGMVTFDGILVRSSGAPLVQPLAVFVAPGRDGGKLAVATGGANNLQIKLTSPAGSGNYVATLRLTQD